MLSKDTEWRRRPSPQAKRHSASQPEFNEQLVYEGTSDASQEESGDDSDLEAPACSSNFRIALVLLGRAGPGVNNVVQGLFEYLKPLGGTVLCIPMGIEGLTAGHAFEVTGSC